MSSQRPGKWVGIVGAITSLFGMWIGGASTSRVYCAWYFAVNIDDYITADFVVDQVEHHGAGNNMRMCGLHMAELVIQKKNTI